jgi:hypothetical protein
LTDSETNQVFTLSQLHETKGITFNKFHIHSWEKLIRQVTDENRCLLPQFQPHHINHNEENHPNTITVPERMSTEQANTTEYVFTDGSLKENNKDKVAVSAAFFGDNHKANHVFRTVGTQTVFNAEAQAIEYGLYTLPLNNTTVITDSKSMTSTISKIQQTAEQYKILLPKYATLSQIQAFAGKIMYKYRKSHKYAAILQSILVQILIREEQGYTVTFHHVFSHLLDHIYLPHKKHHMDQEEQQDKMNKMKQMYLENTMFYLEGNFQADRLCETLPSNSTHYPIQLQSASLPRFILKDNDTNEYASSNISAFIKDKYIQIQNEQLLEEHPELETTKFSPEIDWKASTWPIGDKTTTNDKLCSFQYKLKCETLQTPLKQQQQHQNEATTTTSQCLICLNPSQEPDITHIFSHCTLAIQHNTELWTTIQSQIAPLKTPWFNTTEDSTEHTKFTKLSKDLQWQLTLGDLGYIPAHITKTLNKEQYHKLQSITAESRYTLWKEYWKTSTQIKLTKSNNIIHPSSPPVGEPPPFSGNQQTLSVDLVTGTPLASTGRGQTQTLIKKQSKLTTFFTKLQ